MAEKSLFGTDGIRGTANAEPMSVDTILRVGRAAACVLRGGKNGSRRSVIVGKDTRLSGYMFETALVSGLTSMGVDVWLVGPIPTPGVAFLAMEMRQDAGVVISASHNPFIDNGIKFFGPDGYKLPDSVESQIEAYVADIAEMDRRRPHSAEIGRARRLEDARGRYITYLKHNFPPTLSLDGLRVVLDCANGATYKIAPTVFGELGASVHARGVRPDGININEECGALNPDVLAARVLAEGADIGVAFDGDGDRLIVCDEKGRVFDGDDILAVLAAPLRDEGELGAGVVGTVMTNLGLERYLDRFGVPLHRTAVGDRYVVERMRETGCLVGGEPSGHLLFLSRSTTGDGIVSALLLLAELRKQDRPLSWYAGNLEKYPQEIRNVVVRVRKPFEELPLVRDAMAGAKEKLGDKGRLLVRYSGTENKARVMVEGEDPKEVTGLAEHIASAIEAEIGGES